MTQTKIIELLRRELDRRSFNVIYFDFPNASRSGVGTFGKVALIFEHVYDMSPDLVAVKDEYLLIYEVDNDLKKIIIKKKKYKTKETLLIEYCS